MSKVIKNWRFWLVGIIAVIAFLNLVALPGPEAKNYWLIMAYSKFTAVVLSIVDFMLIFYFSNKGQFNDVHDYLNSDD